MLFNTIDFAVFLPVVFTLYWLLPSKKPQPRNLLLLVASYVFYGWWNWQFLALIIASTLVDYYVARALLRTDPQYLRRCLLGLSLTINLGALGFFKYCNFFLDNFSAAFSFIGQELEIGTLAIILPVGISFYTFQTLSYTIDVYRRKLLPTESLLSFATFVAFFPQLVAGPIERASNLLPQFQRERVFHYPNAVLGLRQILWGLFKKVVVADNCAEQVDYIFNNSSTCSGSTLLLGAIFFSFQIYGDFSGYSDIAIGTARLFGFRLMRNFAYPYFSRDVAEFWRRWHISLSTWFRDYLYFPLGGSRNGILRQLGNTLIVFVVSGFWHGASWTFVAWGALHATLLIPLIIAGKNRRHLVITTTKRVLPTLGESTKILSTFLLVTLGWILFRADSLPHAWNYLAGIFSHSLFESITLEAPLGAAIAAVAVSTMLLVEWLSRESEFALHRLVSSRLIRWPIYYALIASILFLGGPVQEFIYFQF